MDLGVHLVDLAMWVLGFPPTTDVSAALLAGSAPVAADGVEDYASVRFLLGGRVDVRLACSWRLNAGRDAVIEASFYGTGGGASLRNVDGSFYDLRADHFTGTAATTLAAPPEDWGGRAAADWAVRLSHGERFDPAAAQFVQVAEVIDAIYAAAA